MSGKLEQACLYNARPFGALSKSPQAQGSFEKGMLCCRTVLRRRACGAHRGAFEKGRQSFGEAPTELRRSASEKRPRSFGEVLRRSARGASEKRFGEAPAELRRSGFPYLLKRKGPFGEVLRRSARRASEKCFGEAPAELRRSASEKRPRSFGEGPAELRRRGLQSFLERLRRRGFRSPPLPLQVHAASRFPPTPPLVPALLPSLGFCSPDLSLPALASPGFPPRFLAYPALPSLLLQQKGSLVVC